ncbi:hypothetical protein CTAYLR_006845 [Chrysophaeum taylorii]|uniref:polynucleotide adenylyltransferase n=1 Tax=Chrysophaeum taylorii TaxID=2483200 RepID=A0AAD7U5Z2_9STRA|nr:hypothetical protein CTAYLR_006845 [Chrysophaeum taylorii]
MNGTSDRRYFGITPPIDERYPSLADKASTEALESTLRTLGVFESESGRRVRQGVIKELTRVTSAWCADEWRRVAGPSETPRCELRTFGSVRLNVHTPDADIDVVLITPRHCSRGAFFGSLVARLEATPTIGAGRVMPVRDAYTPVIRLRQPPPPPPIVKGPPDYIAWNPRLNPRDRAHLAPIVTPAHPTMNSSYNVGEPQLRAIRDELKHGVDATRRVERLAADLFGGGGGGARTDPTPPDTTAADAARKKAELGDAWRELFSPSDFFLAHRHYVQVDVSASDDDALRRWFAWCESRLRGLVVALDTPGFVRARPHATPIERRDPVSDRKTRSFFVALSFEGHVQHIDLTPCVREFSARVNAWEHRSEDMDLELKHAPQCDLPPWVLHSVHYPAGTTTYRANANERARRHPPPRPDPNLLAPPPPPMPMMGGPRGYVLGHNPHPIAATTLPEMMPPVADLAAAGVPNAGKKQPLVAVPTDDVVVDDDQETRLPDDDSLASYTHQQPSSSSSSFGGGSSTEGGEGRHNAPTPPPALRDGADEDDAPPKGSERRRQRETPAAPLIAPRQDSRASSASSASTQPSKSSSGTSKSDKQVVPPLDQIPTTTQQGGGGGGGGGGGPPRQAVMSPISPTTCSPAKKPRSELGQAEPRPRPAQMSYAQALLAPAGPTKRQVSSSS